MKKLVAAIIVLTLFSLPAFSQTNTDLDSFKAGLQGFADDMASVLPMNSAVGLNWSDPYIGQFLALPPHFGVGVTTGVTTIPYKTVESVLEKAFNEANADIPDVVKKFGLPLPAVALDARIGGFILPFDVGVKAGFIPKFAEKAIGDDVKLDYLLLGGDIRYQLMKQRLILPEISLGVGYNYLKGSVAFGGILDNTAIDLSGTPLAPGELFLTSPDFYIEWESHVVDLKAQAGWKLLILQPSVGIGASRGSSSVSGGAQSTLLYDPDGPGGTPPGALTPLQKQQLKTLGYDVDDFGIGVTSEVSGWSYRVFAGLGINILLLKVDVGLQYNLNGRNYGATVGARLQL